jgi:hypothetical protein
MISERESKLEAQNTELTAENHALQAELAKARELVDMLVVMASASWREANALKAQLPKLHPEKRMGRPRKVNHNAIFRTLRLLIQKTGDPTKRDLNRAMNQAAMVHGITTKRVKQIVDEALRQSGLQWK